MQDALDSWQAFLCEPESNDIVPGAARLGNMVMDQTTKMVLENETAEAPLNPEAWDQMRQVFSNSQVEEDRAAEAHMLKTPTVPVPCPPATGQPSTSSIKGVDIASGTHAPRTNKKTMCAVRQFDAWVSSEANQTGNKRLLQDLPNGAVQVQLARYLNHVSSLLEPGIVLM